MGFSIQGLDTIFSKECFLDSPGGRSFSFEILGIIKVLSRLTSVQADCPFAQNTSFKNISMPYCDFSSLQKHSRPE
jgi:hypothetical protein